MKKIWLMDKIVGNAAQDMQSYEVAVELYDGTSWYHAQPGDMIVVDVTDDGKIEIEYSDITGIGGWKSSGALVED